MVASDPWRASGGVGLLKLARHGGGLVTGCHCQGHQLVVDAGVVAIRKRDLPLVCLHCGDCCLRMSPFGSPCQKLIRHGNFYFCSIYDCRPKECRNHEHPFPVCPIGAEKIGINDCEELRKRIDTGHAMLKYQIDDPDEAYAVQVRLL